LKEWNIGKRHDWLRLLISIVTVVRKEGIYIIELVLPYMLSFGNANVGDLYVNLRVSENGAFLRKSEGLGKSGIICK